MLSYRHAYHAGNHADVLKHIILAACLQALTQKEKPLFYLDTHAGAGMYTLSSEYAQKKLEYKEGIARLWNADNPPEIVQQYLNCVNSFQFNRQLDVYPGSPAIASALLRDVDRLWLNELHPKDIEFLRQFFYRDKRAHCVHGDGLVSLKAVLPPKERRGLIVIDPSYEIKEEYLTIPQALLEAYAKFPTGVYLLWYPIVFQDKVTAMLKRLTKVIPKYLIAELFPLGPATEEARGMNGSGVFLINPPWTLAPALGTALPWLCHKLAQSEKASFNIRYEG